MPDSSRSTPLPVTSKRARPVLACWSLLLLAWAPGLAGCSSEDEGTARDADAFALRDGVWSHGDPSEQEQELLERLQRARANPPAEGELLAELPEAQGPIDFFEVDREQLKADFASYPAAPPLAFDRKLLAYAREHSNDMSDNGFQGHESSSGASVEQRLQAVQYAYSVAAENVFAYAESVNQGHAAMLVDWG